MDAQNIREAVNDAAEFIRKSPPVQRRENITYALVVKSAYDLIQKLREEGYSYDVICRAFSEKGVLRTGANAKNFCSAFLREMRRREKTAVRTDESKHMEKKKADVSSFGNASKGTEGSVTPQKQTNPENSETKKTGGKKLLNMPFYDTGTGVRITKHSDGSFDFD
jgi:hypothetical protein